MERRGSIISWLSGLGLALEFVLLGCTTSPSDSCDCPAPGIATVELPSGLSSPLVSVVVTPPCSTGDAYTDASFTVYGGGYDGGTRWLTVHVSGSDPVTCQVYATLADGTELEASVSFEREMGCCTGIAQSNWSNVFQPVEPAAIDAGVD